MNRNTVRGICAPARPSAAGTLLILVSGVAAALFMLTLAFLMRMRDDGEESRYVLEVAQCRLMLHAGMQFIQESSRLGYATDADRSIEAWGWIDVRDGSIGPKDNLRNQLWTAGRWPAPGTVKRAPMSMLKRPPFAVIPNMYPNRIPDDDNPNSDPAYVQKFGLPVLANPDPMPALDASLGSQDPTNAAQRRSWEIGDQTLYPRQVDSWFRVYRETGSEPDRPAKAGPPGATFIITVGSGGTAGYADWNEVVADGQQGLFANDPGLFEALVSSEVRLRYRVEWSAAVGGAEMRFYQPPYAAGGGNLYMSRSPHAHMPVDASRYRSGAGTLSSSAEPRNYVGTISYIERLTDPPQHW
jgi:hypothetical protein